VLSAASTLALMVFQFVSNPISRLQHQILSKEFSIQSMCFLPPWTE
jgi:hypothetical protein